MSRKTRAKPQRAAAKKPSGVRIIGGQWRGRRLPVSDVNGLRPTSDRLRETLFNWLQPVIHGASCLDLFAGSGVLSFEAMSRGASRACLIEQDRNALQVLRQTRDMLAAETVTVYRGDAVALCQHPPAFADAPYDLVFVDPPWSMPVQQNILNNLLKQRWLKPGALIYLEMPKNSELEYPLQLIEIKRKIVGEALAVLVRYKNNTDS